MYFSEEVHDISTESDRKLRNRFWCIVKLEFIDFDVSSFQVKKIVVEMSISTQNEIASNNGSILISKHFSKADVLIVCGRLVHDVILKDSFRNNFLHPFVDALVDFGFW